VSSVSSGFSTSPGLDDVGPGEALKALGLSKRFEGTVALDDVFLSIERGHIHSLVGENGAGKSTLLGIMSGRVVPSAGKLEVFSQPLHFGQPHVSREQGIVAIYQELTMVPALTAQANVFLGQERGFGPLLSEREMRRVFLKLCDDLDVTIVPTAPARDLPIAQQQILEIMRGIAADARVMLLDEPTAALSEQERDSALRLIRRLKAQGVTVVFVSHHLDEVLAVSDRISVLRNGRLVETRDCSDWTKQELVRSMLGRDVEARHKRRREISGGVALRALNVTVPGAISGVSFEVHAGEIIGLGGLVGSGRTTLLRAIAGLESTSTGRLWIDDCEVPWPRTPRHALRHGIAMVPEDRKRQGLILGMSVADNVTLTDLTSVSRLGVIARRRQRDLAARLVERFGVRRELVSAPARSLSGGNQQRILLAKWLHRAPRVLLADEPTRGVDVGAKADVLASLEGLAEAGIAVVMASSELEEVLEVSDRVVVLADGRSVAELDNQRGQLSVSDVLHRAFSVTDDETSLVVAIQTPPSR
jgi:ABC-type sugar transport system ATPase subunit